MDFSTDLITAPGRLPTVFDSAENIDSMLAAIEERARSETHDVKTKEGREGIASIAHKVSRSKTAINEVGEPKAAALREGWDNMNILRRRVNSRLDALRDEIKAPLLAWRETEKNRVAAHEDRITAIKAFGAYTAALELPVIVEAIRVVEAVIVDDRWQEFEEEAGEAKGRTLGHLRTILVDAEKIAAEAEELKRLRLEADDRKRADEKRERERAEAERTQLAADRAAAAERQKADQELEAERDRSAREARAAESRVAEAEAKGKREAEAERARLNEQAAEATRLAEQRAADKKHRQRILGAVANAITALTMGEDSVGEFAAIVAAAIADGKIPHTRIQF